MQVRMLEVQNFRGISALTWKPTSALCCIIGPGDSGKSTIIDALEAVLSSRWQAFAEADFLSCDTSNPIVIDVTLGELSKPLKSDDKFGLYIRGWTALDELRDEPEDDDEPVITIRLTVDATLEPAWELVCDRVPTKRMLSNRDRLLFGFVRLTGDDPRHLAWGQGSVLAKLTDGTEEAARHLAVAYRAARDSAHLENITSLKKASEAAEAGAKAFGAYVHGTYAPGLELGRSGVSSGSIALHDGGVPLRLAGLGTRRLATLAIQQTSVPEGAVIVVDEIEHGLEPHRIIGALAYLKGRQKDWRVSGKPVGQVVLTSHSDVVVGDLTSDELHVVNRNSSSKRVVVKKASNQAGFAKLMKKTPRALFARRILLCEGQTEHALLLCLREFWTAQKGGLPIEQLGAGLADGNGAEAPDLALALSGLRYAVALYRDPAPALTPQQAGALNSAGVQVFEYQEGTNSEAAIFLASNDETVQELLEVARSIKSPESVNTTVRARISGMTDEIVSGPFSGWAQTLGEDPKRLRMTLSKLANDKSWFKEMPAARKIAPLVWKTISTSPQSSLAKCLNAARDWLYA